MTWWKGPDSLHSLGLFKIGPIASEPGWCVVFLGCTGTGITSYVLLVVLMPVTQAIRILECSVGDWHLCRREEEKLSGKVTSVTSWLVGTCVNEAVRCWTQKEVDLCVETRSVVVRTIAGLGWPSCLKKTNKQTKKQQHKNNLFLPCVHYKYMFNFFFLRLSLKFQSLKELKKMLKEQRTKKQLLL